MSKNVTYNHSRNPAPGRQSHGQRQLEQALSSKALAPAAAQYRPGGNAFETLGVSPESSTDDIRRAYLRLARRYHPDLNSDLAAPAIFKEITRAYEYLLQHGDLERLKLQWEMVETKALYVEWLLLEKRFKTLTGQPVEHRPPPPNTIQNDDLYLRMQKLALYMDSKCPYCLRRASCDRATAFDEVEYLNRQIQEERAARERQALTGLLRRLFGL